MKSILPLKPGSRVVSFMCVCPSKSSLRWHMKIVCLNRTNPTCDEGKLLNMWLIRMYWTCSNTPITLQEVHVRHSSWNSVWVCLERAVPTDKTTSTCTRSMPWVTFGRRYGPTEVKVDCFTLTLPVALRCLINSAWKKKTPAYFARNFSKLKNNDDIGKHYSWVQTFAHP